MVWRQVLRMTWGSMSGCWATKPGSRGINQRTAKLGRTLIWTLREKPGVAPQRLGGGADLRERRADLRGNWWPVAVSAQHLPRLALEQVHAQGLQRLTRAADGAVGDVQLQRQGKALPSRRRHKGADRVQRGQAGHAGIFTCGLGTLRLLPQRCRAAKASCGLLIKVSQPGAHSTARIEWFHAASPSGRPHPCPCP